MWDTNDYSLRRHNTFGLDVRCMRFAEYGSVEELRGLLAERCAREGIRLVLPEKKYCTDNAAMIAMTGYYKFGDGDFCPLDKPAYSRTVI